MSEALRGGPREALSHGPVGRGGDDEHGILPESAREAGRGAGGAREEPVAAPGDGRLEHLDDDARLARALPHAARLEVGSGGEVAADLALEDGQQGVAVDGDGLPAVAPPLSGNARADVEANGAGGREGARKRGHMGNVSRREALRDRVGRHGAPSRFWLYVEPGPGEGELTIETSWLPEEALATLPRVGAATRLPNGSIRIVLSARNVLAFQRITGALLAHLRGEAFGE